MSLDDPRWQRLNDPTYVCRCCRREFGGVFDVSFDHPDQWPHGSRAESGQNALGVGDDRLGRDLCLLGESRFLRCTLQIPIKDTDVVFGYGVWGCVSPENFEQFLQSYNGDETDEKFEGCFAWLCNALKGWDMPELLPCVLEVGKLAQRPSLWVQTDSDHPLVEAQKDGLDFDQILDLYAAAGDDIRPHLNGI